MTPEQFLTEVTPPIPPKVVFLDTVRFMLRAHLASGQTEITEEFLVSIVKELNRQSVIQQAHIFQLLQMQPPAPIVIPKELAEKMDLSSLTR